MKIDPSAITVFARDEDGTLVPARDPEGNPIDQVLVGKLSLTDVLTDAPQPPHFKWARRILAILLAWAGASMLLPRSRRQDRVLSLAISVVPLAAIAAFFWFDVRMLAFSILTLVAVLAALVALWRWHHAIQGG